ncbi:hypothetical protein [Pelagicoccus sp. SDUM812003]|uniref:hypothetical protein n=1 Tax=Pelagicoccus sp. SDUM812003 TaxID=3041267 RepID=UPI00280ECFD0|nr:hypothetical protein [Pelagicoccus sp. SDUM812003]MDQ8205741.1 hypothetical protein [Pelagicoccus sp. SDUM812003]
MKISLSGYKKEFLKLEDLEAIIPTGRKGKALNYGQGEGQVQIDDSVWGVYVGRSKEYFIQYEEGSLSKVAFKDLLNDLIDHLSESTESEMRILGIHENE